MRELNPRIVFHSDGFSFEEGLNFILTNLIEVLPPTSLNKCKAYNKHFKDFDTVRSLWFPTFTTRQEFLQWQETVQVITRQNLDVLSNSDTQPGTSKRRKMDRKETLAPFACGLMSKLGSISYIIFLNEKLYPINNLCEMIETYIKIFFCFDLDYPAPYEDALTALHGGLFEMKHISNNFVSNNAKSFFQF